MHKAKKNTDPNFIIPTSIRRKAFYDALQKISTKSTQLQYKPKLVQNRSNIKQTNNKSAVIIKKPKGKKNHLILTDLARKLRQVHKTKDLCVNINTCIALGMFSNKLFKFFNEFKNFNFVKKCSILKSEGNNGVLYMIQTVILNIAVNSLLKMCICTSAYTFTCICTTETMHINN